MVDKLQNFWLMLLTITIPILFSCASTQQKQSEPRDAEFYYNRGVAYYNKGQYDEAILDYGRALEINPRLAKAYFARGNVYDKLGQHDEAILDFTKTLEINPWYAEAYYNRGRSYYVKKEYDESWKDIKRAQDLGYKIPAEFLDDLRKASERKK
jgi:tetratricopeptide (TPR) repeat protein